MRNIVVEVYSLEPKKLSYIPVHGDGDYYDDYCGYDVKDVTKDAKTIPCAWDIVLVITDRRNNNHIFLEGSTLKDGRKKWYFKDEEKDEGTVILPYDHISVYETLNNGNRIYLF